MLSNVVVEKEAVEVLVAQQALGRVIVDAHAVDELGHELVPEGEAVIVRSSGFMAFLGLYALASTWGEVAFQSRVKDEKDRC